MWRFFTYQFVHVGLEHIAFNTLMQLIVGLPLEMAEPGWEGTARLKSLAVQRTVFIMFVQIYRSFIGSCLSTHLELCLGLWVALFQIHISVKLSSCTIMVLNIRFHSVLNHHSDIFTCNSACWCLRWSVCTDCCSPRHPSSQLEGQTG